MSRRPALTPCPDRPNCVSTESEDPRHRIAPMPFRCAPGEAQARLRALLLALPRTTITRDEPGLLGVTFRSRLFRFPDRAELVIDDEARLVRFRSGAATGHWDFGVNRRRMEALREAFARSG